MFGDTNKALRRILGVKWWHRVSNDRVREIVSMEMSGTRLQKGGSDCTGNTRLASAGKKRERKAEGDVDAHNEARSW